MITGRGQGEIEKSERLPVEKRIRLLTNRAAGGDRKVLEETGSFFKSLYKAGQQFSGF